MSNFTGVTQGPIFEHRHESGNRRRIAELESEFDELKAENSSLRDEVKKLQRQLDMRYFYES